MNKLWWIKFGMTNALTFLRVIGIFTLIPIYNTYGGFITFICSAIFFLTDFIDGFMARYWKTSTFFGSFFDALSDKAFLIINFILLLNITPLAIIPIILELSIALIQSIKYLYKIKVISNKTGKAKMWIAGITITIGYLIVDEKFLRLIKLSNIINWDKTKLFAILLAPLIISELMNIISYVKEIFIWKKEKRVDCSEKQKKNNKLIIKELQNKSFIDLLFDHEIYEKYKDYGSLKYIWGLVKRK